LPETRTQTLKNIKWIHLRTDLLSSYNYWKNGKLTIGEWIKSMKGKKFYSVISLKDPKPFLSELKMGITHGFKSLFGKADSLN